MDIEKNRECKIDLDFIGGIENNPFENNNFDLVLCLEVLEHIENYQGAIKEIYRILKDGGRLLLTVPLMAVGYHNDFYRFTPPVLKKILESEGFKINKINSTGGYFRMLGWQISKISYLIKKPKNRAFIIPYYLIKIPVGLVFQIFIPLILFKLDFLDNKKTETCGYLVVAEK
jgi:ubiquinone/menaquinone biosynthesis C-methylase UbiE